MEAAPTGCEVARGAKGNFEDLDAALSQDYLVGGKLTLADLAVRGCFSRLRRLRLRIDTRGSGATSNAYPVFLGLPSYAVGKTSRGSDIKTLIENGRARTLQSVAAAFCVMPTIQA